jgi:hypothetical protein
MDPKPVPLTRPQVWKPTVPDVERPIREGDPGLVV